MAHTSNFSYLGGFLPSLHNNLKKKKKETNKETTKPLLFASWKTGKKKILVLQVGFGFFKSFQQQHRRIAPVSSHSHQILKAESTHSAS